MKIDWMLLKRSLFSDLSAGERKCLEAWLQESPKHRELYREMKTFWANRDSFRPDQERLTRFCTDYECRLERVSKQRRMKHFQRTMCIAASLAILLGFGWMFIHRQIDEKVQMVKTQTEIIPGGSKAILVMAEGKTVHLCQDTTVLEKVGGVEIRNDDNALIYSETEGETEVPGENQLIIPRGGEYAVCLSDGTKVWLNSASELRYPVRFTGRERRVYLKGEAYFEVAHSTHQAFIVATDEINVKVYGTAFNMNTRAIGGIQTTLVRGSVSVCSETMSEQFIKPNQMAQYDSESGHLTIKEVDVNNYISWRAGMYVFENRTIEQIMEELSLWYDVEVFFKNHVSRTQSFSGSLPRYHEIGEMLSVIEKTSHVKFEVRGRTIIVN